MTNICIVDRRIETTPTFGQLAVGQWFMMEGCLYCKTEELLNSNCTSHYNAFVPEGGLTAFDNDELVEPVEGIQITISK